MSKIFLKSFVVNMVCKQQLFKSHLYDNRLLWKIEDWTSDKTYIESQIIHFGSVSLRLIALKSNTDVSFFTQILSSPPHFDVLRVDVATYAEAGLSGFKFVNGDRDGQWRGKNRLCTYSEPLRLHISLETYFRQVGPIKRNV